MTEDQALQFTVLLEDIKSLVGVIAEGHLALNEKLEGLREELGQKVDRVAADVVVLKADVGTLKTDMVQVHQRLDRIEHHIGLNGASARPGRMTARKPPKSRE